MKFNFTRHPIALAIASLSLSGATVHAQNTPAVEADAVKTLPSVTVSASADASPEGVQPAFPGGQVARGGRLGILGSQSVMDAPFNVTNYTQALIQDQQASSVGDVLLNDPSVRVARGFGNYQQLYVVRGFPLFSDDMSYNGLYGLLPRQYLAAELVERVEVLRGANAFVNGAAPGGSGIGGAVNVMPKRAPNDPLTQLTVGMESGPQAYVATDIARRFGPDGSTGIRINAVRRDGDTSIDREERELSLLALGLDYRTSGMRLSADIGYQDHQLDQPRPSVTVAPGLSIPRAPQAHRNFAQPWTYSNERDLFGTLRGEFDLNRQVTAWFAAGARRGVESGVFANPTVIDGAGNTTAFRFDNARKDIVKTAETGIRAKFATGEVGHTVSASLSALKQDSRNAYAFSDFSNGVAGNLYAPSAAPAPAADFFVGGDLSSPLVTQKTEVSSLALADTLSIFQERLLITLGARHQKLKDTAYDYTTGVRTSGYDRSETTPVAGIVYKPTDMVSLYANYAEGLTRGPVASGFGVVNQGEVFDPIVSRQKEIGAKLEASKVGGAIAFFTTNQPNAVVDPATSRFDVSGEQRNRGAELSVYGQPLRGVRLLGGITFLDAEQTGTAGGQFDGNDAIGVPRRQTNVGVEWDVPAVPRLTLSGRVINTSSQYADAANTQEVPGWTRFDFGARYAVNVGRQLVTIRGRVDNVANRDYWASAGGFPGSGYLVLGAPRTVSVSASLDF